MDRAQFTTATESQQKTELNRNAMKVVIINGSPRCKGFTSAILHSIESELTANKIDVRFVDLSKKNILHCTGCCSCYKTGHCHISDDADGLSDEIASADGLVIGSPTYASNVSGILKDFIDRGHFVIEQLLHKKYCVVVASGENYGNGDTKKYLSNLVLFSGGHLCKSIRAKATFNKVKEANDLDESTRKKVTTASAKLIKGMSCKKKYFFQAICHSVIFNFGIKPFVNKKGQLYQGVLNKWKSLEDYK